MSETYTISNHFAKQPICAGELQKDITLTDLIKLAAKHKVEIENHVTPNETTITIRPWVPFTYTCPYENRPADIGDLLQKGKLNEP